MSNLEDVFDERKLEIDSYLDLLRSIEIQAQSGPPKLGSDGPVITSQQIKILYSGVFLQLYNLIEATVVRCLEAVTVEAVPSSSCRVADLSDELRREWIRVFASTHTDLNYQNRLDRALAVCEHITASLSITAFELDTGSGGNWDDNSIHTTTQRIGLTLNLPREVFSDVKRPVRNDQGPLVLIKNLRNMLAHGSISFAECGGTMTVSELQALARNTIDYLEQLILAFQEYITDELYLHPSKRTEGAQQSI